MSVMTFEATIENGQVALPAALKLPDHTKVYVVVPDQRPLVPLVGSPRLLHPEQAVFFIKEVSEEAENAELR